MDDRITLSHGGGGTRTQDLVEEVFLSAYGRETLRELGDSALLAGGEGRLAFTTDAFVVKPLFFRGGDIGRLSVAGTVNDLAVAGAQPRALSAGFVIEEGLALSVLSRVAASMAAAADEGGVEMAAGDTKVVERGAADELFVVTAGVGFVPPDRDWGPHRIRPGDRILISGTLGDHGVAIASEREGIRFETDVESDAAPLTPLVEALAAAGGVRAMRDPTRGGAAAALNELARASGAGFVLREEALPVRPAVAAACDLLGFDPLTVANEGKLVVFVDPARAEDALAAARAHPLGREASLAGEVVDRHPGVVVAETRVGGRKVVDMPLGEGLPRIC